MSKVNESKIVYVFNKYFFEFLDAIICISPELEESISTSCKVKNIHTSKHIARFSKHLSSAYKDVINASPEELLSLDSVKSIVIIGELTVGDVVNKLKTEKLTGGLESFVYYIYILTLYASLAELQDEDDKEQLFEVYTNAIKDIQHDNEPNLSLILDKSIVALLENIKSVSKLLKHDADDDAEHPPEFVENAGEILNNTKIGALAQEISKEIDISNLNIDKPEDLLNVNNLFSGNSPIGDIIGKVGSKIHEKINKGELKHEELMTEAFGMLKMFNNSGGGNAGGGGGGLGGLGNIFNNPMMQEMMKNMGKGKMPNNPEAGRASNKRVQLKQKLLEKQTK